mmetsp:Transcript_24583/g.67850  ORF Transcript_24583/g.67850 Transcript_24583/m.67850 type:complete len:358 (-) Transcript_24583:275-1348(-)
MQQPTAAAAGLPALEGLLVVLLEVGPGVDQRHQGRVSGGGAGPHEGRRDLQSLPLLDVHPGLGVSPPGIERSKVLPRSIGGKGQPRPIPWQQGQQPVPPGREANARVDIGAIGPAVRRRQWVLCRDLHGLPAGSEPVRFAVVPALVAGKELFPGPDVSLGHKALWIQSIREVARGFPPKGHEFHAGCDRMVVVEHVRAEEDAVEFLEDRGGWPVSLLLLLSPRGWHVDPHVAVDVIVEDGSLDGFFAVRNGHRQRGNVDDFPADKIAIGKDAPVAIRSGGCQNHGTILPGKKLRVLSERGGTLVGGTIPFFPGRAYSHDSLRRDSNRSERKHHRERSENATQRQRESTVESIPFRHY